MDVDVVTLGTLQLVGTVIALLFTGSGMLIAGLMWVEKRSTHRSEVLHQRIERVREECMRRDEMERILRGVQGDFDKISTGMREGFSGLTTRIDAMMIRTSSHVSERPRDG
ncbi:hypothetical protein T8K17_11260 [Thalassobaculum sp. OXR-137]|uniref:hypothetical protein n=1 Tax=Thalassobaculum sp. OXR-137 TaxID=3100173 RepID=UPI002AC905EA|nr:hypothetical protein [Thalassobaculum sp. OXR-137]WPZ36713.1 hypothetical protein T8K17_11260 [Thalassobaculum sp. OXR-137]